MYVFDCSHVNKSKSLPFTYYIFVCPSLNEAMVIMAYSFWNGSSPLNPINLTHQLQIDSMDANCTVCCHLQCNSYLNNDHTSISM